MTGSIPILMYHQVTPRPVPPLGKYMLRPRSFAAQMAWLALAGYTPITPDTLLEHRAGRVSLPPRPVIITFDDGFRDCLDYAVPVLQAQGFTAVFYLVAGLMGKVAEWLVTRFGIEIAMMDWDGARRLEAASFQCGSHTLSHPALADLDVAACRAELCRSRQMLEDRLGRPVRHLAYPFGSFDERVRAIAAESGYHTACSTRQGLSTVDDDRLALHRVPVNGQDSLLDFICRLHTGQPLRETLRGAAHRLERRTLLARMR